MPIPAGWSVIVGGIPLDTPGTLSCRGCGSRFDTSALILAHLAKCPLDERRRKHAALQKERPS